MILVPNHAFSLLYKKNICYNFSNNTKYPINDEAFTVIWREARRSHDYEMTEDCISNIDLLPDSTLRLVETITFENHNWKRAYSYEKPGYSNIMSIVASLRAKYGEVEDILCIRLREGTNEVSSYEEYDSFEELCTGFTEDKFNSSHILQFSCVNRYVDFRIRRIDKTLEIISSEGSLGIKEYDPSQVFYYRDAYGTLVKYDENKMMVYDYDRKKRKWVKSRWRWPDFCDREESRYERVQLSPAEMLKYAESHGRGE